ncbi:hypothetical protein B0H21DRAFT_801020 [Amylocystis lapponica]|nr:hypothetical protein B0H21DRAFT_801020 [Amylocystis lapponica]
MMNSFGDIYVLNSPPVDSADGLSSPSPLIGIFADVNLRQLAANRAPPVGCVNTADVLGNNTSCDNGVPLSPSYCDVLDRASTTPGSHGVESKADIYFPEEAITAIVSVLSALKREDTPDQRGAVQTTHVPPSAHPSEFHDGQGYSMQPPMPTRTTKFEMTALPVPGQFISSGLLPQQPCGPLPFAGVYMSLDLQYPPQGEDAFNNVEVKPVRSQSPVLNAHLGISLDDLRKRAEDFRQCNPGMELDKTWLQAFAGRLSQRGELLEDYRCYVIGCTQRNRRRDHILVHVGAHVEHRPFQCEFCPMRFLRKNECKRHESSHAGLKPFSCPICAPYQDRSFVRQDLLQRHMRATHGVLPNPNRRKRARIEPDENWP